MLRLMAPLIPISRWREIATCIFNLRFSEVDTIENIPTRKEILFQLLHQSVQQNGMTAQELKKCIERAVTDGVGVDPSSVEIFDRLSLDMLRGGYFL